MSLPLGLSWSPWGTRKNCHARDCSAVLDRLDFHALPGSINTGDFGMGFAPVVAFIFLIFLILPLQIGSCDHPNR